MRRAGPGRLKIEKQGTHHVIWSCARILHVTITGGFKKQANHVLSLTVSQLYSWLYSTVHR
jgi:hypothetical protein